VLVGVCVERRRTEEGRGIDQRHRAVEVDRAGLELGVLGLEVQLAAEHVHQQPAGHARFEELVHAVVAIVLQVAPLAVGVARVGGDRASHRVGEGAARVDAGPVRIIAADARDDLAVPLVARLARGHDQRAGHGIAAVQRALGALQDFDLGDARQLLVERIGVGLQHPVHDQREVGLGVAGRIDAADADLHVARLRGLHLRDARGQRDEVLRPLDARAPDVGGRERRDRRRHVPDPLLALSRRDDDFLDLSGGRRGLEYRGHGQQCGTVGRSEGQQPRLGNIHVIPLHMMVEPNRVGHETRCEHTTAANGSQFAMRRAARRSQ
jgi:hypothetical protein